MAHRQVTYPSSSSHHGATFQGDFSARDHVDFSQDNRIRNIYRFSKHNKSTRAADQSQTLQEMIPTLLGNMSVFKQNGIVLQFVNLFMSKIDKNNKYVFVDSARNVLLEHNSNHKKAVVSIVDEAMEAGMSGGDGWRCYNSIKKQVNQNIFNESFRLDCDLKSLLDSDTCHANRSRGSESRDGDGDRRRVRGGGRKQKRNSSRSRSRDRGKYINKYKNNNNYSNNYVNKKQHNNSNVRGHDINDTNVVQKYDINVVQGYGTNNKQTKETNESNGTNNLRIWLNSFGLCQYYGAFARQGFDNDFALIDTLTDAELREVGVAKMAHRKKILQHIGKKEMILKLWKEEDFEIMCGDDEVPRIVFESNTLSFKEKLKQQSIEKKERENRKDRETMSSDGAATSPFPTDKCAVN